MPRKQQRRWVSQVKTNSTHPPAGLFTKRRNHRENPGFEEGLSERAAIRPAHAELLHQPRGKGTAAVAPR